MVQGRSGAVAPPRRGAGDGGRARWGSRRDWDGRWASTMGCAGTTQVDGAARTAGGVRDGGAGQRAAVASAGSHGAVWGGTAPWTAVGEEAWENSGTGIGIETLTNYVAAAVCFIVLVAAIYWTARVPGL